MNQVIDTNFRGLLHCTRRAFKLMSASNDFGMIVNINSVTGRDSLIMKTFLKFILKLFLGHLVPHTSFSLNVYCPTKFGVQALTESIRQELYRSGNKKIRIGVSVRMYSIEFAI